MTYNARKKKKTNKLIIGIIIVICIIISISLLSLMNIPIFSTLSSKIIYGIDAFFGSVSGVISSGTDYFGNTKKLNEKINDLETKLKEKEIELVELDKLKVENDSLRELLNIEEKYSHFEKIYANVITRSYDNWNDTFVINKGKIDGVKEKQTVISKDGLVGYISHVYDNTSVVTTILDTNSAVSVKISSINALALIKGEYSLKASGKVKLINIPIETEIAVDETLYTSGIGELYIKGIPIGKITEVVNKKNDIDRYAIIKVFADIESIDVVAVIIK